MGYISKAKHYLESYYETDEPLEQIHNLKEAIMEIETLIYIIEDDSKVR